MTVVEERHITRAAERLGIQQPPLSLQIRSFERELGVELFKRLPRGVHPTEAGLVLYEKLKPVFAQIEQALAAARSTARGEQGRLVIGMSSSSAFSPIILRLIRRFREIAPAVAVSLQESDAEELMHALQNERVDIVFTRSMSEHLPGIAIETILQEEMIAVLPSGHRAKYDIKRGVKLAQLADERFILYRRPGGPGLYDGIIAACRDAGFSPKIAQEALRIPSVLNLVSAGLGISIVPASLHHLVVDGVVYCRLIDCQTLKAPLYLMSRSDGGSGAVKLFQENVEEGIKDSRRRKNI